MNKYRKKFEKIELREQKLIEGKKQDEIQKLKLLSKNTKFKSKLSNLKKVIEEQNNTINLLKE